MTAICATCAADGRKGYCAPLRCYCGHKTCHAFASWAPLAKPNVTSIPTATTSTTWADREDSTWIDKL